MNNEAAASGAVSTNSGETNTKSLGYSSQKKTASSTAEAAIMPALRELEERMRVEPGNEAYWEALRQSPAVVRTEADPRQFLRREDFNVGAAARRMCRYWNLRKQVFRADRFARPLLDLSGNGALAREALAAVSTGVAVNLPNDDQGRSVICNDLSRLTLLSRLVMSEFRQQYFFYMYCLLCMNPKTQTEGVVVLRVLLDPFDTKFSADQFKRNIVRMMEEVIPARMHSFHVCCLPSKKAAKRHFIQTILPQFVQALGQDLAQKVVIHLENSAEEMAGKLQSRGLHKAGLPPSLGGSWSYESHHERLFGPDTKLPASVSVSVAALPANSQLDVLAHAAECQHLCLESEISQIPDAEKQAYLEAARQGVFEDAVPFVKFCGGDRNNAARRLIEYWKNRKDIFQERAFRPLLDLSGNGALTKRDIDTLEDGFPCTQLPNSTCGNTLIYLDQSYHPSSTKPIDPEAQMRCTMYLLARAASDASTSGIILLRLVRQAEFDRQRLQQLASLVDCIPAEVPYIHFCCLTPKGGRRRNFMDTFVPVYEQLLTMTFGKKAVIHVAEKRAKLLGELLSCGFQKKVLPTTLGGTWSFDSANLWLHGKQPVAEVSSESAKKPVAVSKNSSAGLSSLIDAAHQSRLQDRKARKRMMDAIYARKRRQRENSEQATLQQRCYDLTIDNKKLEQENQRLEQMLADAKTKISRGEYGMSIAGKKAQNKKRKRVPIPPQAASIKKPRADPASTIGGNSQYAASSSRLGFSSTFASTPAASSGVEHSGAASKVLDLLNTIQSERQQADLTRQRDELLLQILAAQRRSQDRQQVIDQQSLLQQLAEAMTGRNPQQASTAFLFNQKNATQEQQPLPLRLQDFLGAPARQQVNIVPVKQPQPSTLSTQSLLNQLLVANVSQSNGFSSLQDIANSLVTTPQNRFGHQETQVKAPPQDHLLQHILGMSSLASSSAHSSSTNQMQDFILN